MFQNDINVLFQDFKKHLDTSDVSASVFFKNNIMFKSIKNCLNQPNVVEQYGTGFTHQKVSIQHLIHGIYELKESRY